MCVCVPMRLSLIQTEQIVAGVGQHQLLQPVTQLLREIQQLHALWEQTGDTRVFFIGQQQIQYDIEVMFFSKLGEPALKKNYPCVSVKGQRSALERCAPSSSFQLVKVWLAGEQEIWHCDSKSLSVYVALAARIHRRTTGTRTRENGKNTQVAFVHCDKLGAYFPRRQACK